MAFPPQAFIVGAQKAGTTSLAILLDTQPGITLSSPKEARYFTQYRDRDLDWYRDRFDGPEESLFLDASPDYACGPTDAYPSPDPSRDPWAGVPERIHALSPNAKFIYIMRDPVARVYSAYWHDRRTGNVDGSFEEAIEANPFYLRTSDYAGQIRNYLDRYSLDDFLLLGFEEFKRDPERCVKRCCEFLDVDFVGLPEADDTKHKNKSYQLSGAAKLVRLLAGSHSNFERLASGMRSVLPKGVSDWLQAMMTRDIPKMSERQRAELRERLADRKRDLQALTGFDVSVWD